MGDGKRDIRENLVLKIFEKKTDLSLLPSSLVRLQDETGEYHQDLQELYSQSLPFQSLYHHNHLPYLEHHLRPFPGFREQNYLKKKHICPLIYEISFYFDFLTIITNQLFYNTSGDKAHILRLSREVVL